MGDEELVTGEAVALALPAATLGSRILSGILDLLVGIACLIVVGQVLSRLSTYVDSAIGTTLGILMVALPIIVLPTTMETLTRGKSVGKYALGLRTVRDDAGPITFRHALTRALVGLVEIWAFAGVPAAFVAMLHQRGKRLGDVAAGTYVIRERFTARLPEPAVMPGHLAAWAASADIAALPDRLALAARRYLLAEAALTPAARDSLGRGILADLLAHVSPWPPAGSNQHDVIAAILAERRARDSARLAREAGLRSRLLGTTPL